MILRRPDQLDADRIRFKRVPGDRIDDPLRAFAQLDEQFDHLSGHLVRIRLAGKGIASNHLDAGWNELSDRAAAAPDIHLRGALKEIPGFPGQFVRVPRTEAEQGNPGLVFSLVHGNIH